MCFSAEASFAATALLGVVSVATLRKAQPNQRLVAAIPLCFAIQQASEGILWMTLHHGVAPSMMALLAKNVFLFFAYIFWPFWVPLSVYYFDQQLQNNKLLRMTMAAGTAWAAMLAFLMVTKSTTVHIVHRHIAYHIGTGMHWLASFGAFVYLGIVITPLLLSANNRLRFFAFLVTLAHISTFAVARYWFTSIWCFWSAVLSAFIYWAIDARCGNICNLLCLKACDKKN